MSAARSVFQAPNTFDQQDAGQDQQQHQHSFNLAPSLTRTLGRRAVVEFNAWVRRDVVEYDGSANLFDDQPAVLSQHRTLTNAGAQGDAVLRRWRAHDQGRSSRDDDVARPSSFRRV